MVVANETDEAARATWESDKAGAGQEAIAWLGLQGAPTLMKARGKVKPVLEAAG